MKSSCTSMLMIVSFYLLRKGLVTSMQVIIKYFPSFRISNFGGLKKRTRKTSFYTMASLNSDFLRHSYRVFESESSSNTALCLRFPMSASLSCIGRRNFLCRQIKWQVESTSSLPSGNELIRNNCSTTSLQSFTHFCFRTWISDLPEQPHLFLEFSGASGTAVAEQASLAESICMDGYNCKGFHIESSEEARKKLWAARHVLYYASIALRPGAYCKGFTAWINK